jgi:cell division protein FtsI (penicillin-binding protein 3)
MMKPASQRPTAFVANPLLRAQLSGMRSSLLILLISLAFLALAARAVYVQVVSQDFLVSQGERRYARNLELPASRGDIYDRNGAVLASSLPVSAITATPRQLSAEHPRFGELARLLELKPEELAARLSGGSRNFAYLKRQVEPDVAARVRELRLPGITELPEYRRQYPASERLAQIVGFTDIEDRGQEGIELAHNSLLTGTPGSRRVIRDKLGQIIEEVETTREPRNGQDLTLSIDATIQSHVFNAVRQAVADHKAVAGAAVVLDVRSGELLAIANWPSFDPNDKTNRGGAGLRNRAITDTFEPGSTLKPFTAALALETRRVAPHTVIDTGNGKITVGGHQLSDVKGYGSLTVEQVIQKSSNVGTVRIAQSIPSKELWETLTSVGLGQAPQLGFPGAVAGRVRPHRNWKPVDHATISYGYGLSVSLIQLARAYSVFARDGDLLPLTILRGDGPLQTTPVFSPATARTMRRMLEAAASIEGTAPLAQVPGYRVAGKTGTARKLENGRYVSKYVASFVGFAPVSNPRVVVAVMIDEPSTGTYYGGAVAGPLFSKVTSHTLRTLRVSPDAPLIAAPGPEPDPRGQRLIEASSAGRLALADGRRVSP